MLTIRGFLHKITIFTLACFYSLTGYGTEFVRGPAEHIPELGTLYIDALTINDDGGLAGIRFSAELDHDKCRELTMGLYVEGRKIVLFEGSSAGIDSCESFLVELSHESHPDVFSIVMAQSVKGNWQVFVKDNSINNIRGTVSNIELYLDF